MLKQIIGGYEFEYVPIVSGDEEKIIKLFNEDIEFKCKTGDEFYYYGVYHYICKNYGEAKKYYLKAIDLGNVAAMNNLAFLFENVKK